MSLYHIAIKYQFSYVRNYRKMAVERRQNMALALYKTIGVIFPLYASLSVLLLLHALVSVRQRGPCSTGDT